MASFQAMAGTVRHGITDLIQTTATLRHHIQAEIARDSNYASLLLQQLIVQANALEAQLQDIELVQAYHERRLTELEAWKRSQILAADAFVREWWRQQLQ
jgi:hypothetical protein